MPALSLAGYALNSTWRTLLHDLGLVPADVLRRAGLADDLLLDPAARLCSADYYRLWASIEHAAGEALPVAIRLCEVIRSESFSPLLFAALCSPNLLVAAQRIARYKPLIAPMRLVVTETPDRVALEFEWLDAPLTPPVSLVLLELLFGVTLARLGTRTPVRPLAVTTPRLPASGAPYEEFLGVPVRQGAKHQLIFAYHEATRPFLTSSDVLWTTFEPDLRQRLADLQTPATTTQRVRAALLEGLPSGQVAVEATASKLALSKRTLQRHLGAEGSSYQQLLSETRAALARHYVEKTVLPAPEIAFLLGFAETQSFYRAFRSWTGSTPQQVRQQVRWSVASG